jgi:hypothetical protein
MRELDRCLLALAHELPREQRAVMARYVDPHISRRKLPGRLNKRTHEVRFQLPQNTEIRAYAQLPDRGSAHEWTVLVASWPVWATQSLVGAGVFWLSENFRGEPYLPAEFLAA